MANTAALILYPCFKDLEKSHANFVESVSPQRKSRKSSRYDKKEPSVLRENYNSINFTYNHRENTATNTSRVRKKDVEILPTLIENDEKGENHKTLSGSGKISGSLTNFEKKGVGDGTDAIFSLYEGEARTNRKFSNHSLVTYDAFDQSESSNLAEGSRDTSISADLSSSKNKADNCKLQASKCRPRMTVMPNTNEFQDLDFGEPMKSNKETAESTTRKTNEREPDTRAPSTRNWRLIIGLIWVITQISALIAVTINNATTQSSHMEQVELVTVMPTNYDICLLIVQLQTPVRDRLLFVKKSYDQRRATGTPFRR